MEVGVAGEPGAGRGDVAGVSTPPEYACTCYPKGAVVNVMYPSAAYIPVHAYHQYQHDDI